MGKQNLMITVDTDLYKQAELAGLKGKMSSMFENILRSTIAIKTNNIQFFDAAKKERELEAKNKEIENLAIERNGIQMELALIREKLQEHQEKQAEEQKLEAAKINTCVLCNFIIQDHQKREKSFEHENKQYFHHKDCMLNKRFIIDEKEVSGFNKLMKIREDIPAFLQGFINKLNEVQ